MLPVDAGLLPSEKKVALIRGTAGVECAAVARDSGHLGRVGKSVTGSLV